MSLENKGVKFLPHLYFLMVIKVQIFENFTAECPSTFKINNP